MLPESVPPPQLLRSGPAPLAPQIFNLDTKAKLKSVQFAENVVFWKWITGTKLGLVTATAVYHWAMEVGAAAAAGAAMRNSAP